MDKNLLNNTYLEYTLIDLEEELDFLNRKESNRRLSFAARKQATSLKIEVMEALEVFDYFQQKGFTMDNQTLRNIIETVTQKSIGELQGSFGTTVVKNSGEYFDKSIDATRRGLNKFGSWLADKTEGGVK